MSASRSPQTEDGHTRIANELLEAMCRAGLSARQWAVVMAVVRKTYGYGKKADDLSLSQLEAMTGIAKPHASRAVNDLVAANVLRRTAGTFGNRLSINKRYQQWAFGKPAAGVTDSVTKGLPKEQPQLPKEQPQTEVTDMATPVTDSVTGAGVTDSVTGVTDSVTGYRFGHAEVTDSVTTKGNSTKERLMSGKPDEGDQFQHMNRLAWEAIKHLNGKCGTGYRNVESNLKLVRARLNEGATLDDVKAVIDDKALQWLDDKKMEQYLRPATLFNATNFNQYIGQLGDSKNEVDDQFAGAI